MDIYTVSFFGHRVIERPILIERHIEKLIRDLLTKKEYVEFLVGRDGDFDQIVSAAVRRCKRTIRDDNSTLIWVLPYSTAEFRNNEKNFWEYYDEIEICGSSSNYHFKCAHQIRNREMVDRSNLVVFCVQRENGGAWQTMKYARKQDVPYININDNIIGSGE